MNQKIHDENLTKNETAQSDTVEWYDIPCEKIDLYGILPENEGVLTRRLPREIALTVSGGVAAQSGYGAGGRIRFSTDSPFVAIKASYGSGAIPTVCNHIFSYGFDMYKFVDGKESFVATCRPTNDFDFKNAEFKMNTKCDGKMTSFTVNMPHFSEVKKLLVGIEKGSTIDHGEKYINSHPVVFYGSSITHGAAAGRPGNTYESFISQKYNLDYINLGFAGNAKGESAMAEYISTLYMSVFVCDYDHNAPSVEHLSATYHKFYEIVREKHPDIPYIMVSKPDFFPNPALNAKRRDVIIESFNKAKKNGDKNVYFIDGESLFEGEFYESCTSDGCHPNDIGFFRMAQKIGEVVARSMNLI